MQTNLVSVDAHQNELADPRSIGGRPGAALAHQALQVKSDDAHRSLGEGVGDPRSARILAKTIYRELRASGLDERAVMALASELLGLVAAEIREARPSE
jgi:hypothetical protein